MIGTWFMTGSPQVMDVLAYNLDFAIIDMEHGQIDYNDLLTLKNTAGDLLILVRPPTNNPTDIQHLMDIGFFGIIVPHVSTELDIQNLIKYSSYPPKGELGFSPFTPAFGYGAYAKQDIFRAIIIESKEGVSNLDALLAYDEINMVYIGVYDLSKEYGFDMYSDEMKALMQYIATIARKHNKDLGAIYKDAESKAFLEELEVEWMVYKTDTAIIFDATKDI